jgi:hypothetical protein
MFVMKLDGNLKPKRLYTPRANVIDKTSPRFFPGQAIGSISALLRHGVKNAESCIYAGISALLCIRARRNRATTSRISS